MKFFEIIDSWIDIFINWKIELNWFYKKLQLIELNWIIATTLEKYVILKNLIEANKSEFEQWLL